MILGSHVTEKLVLKGFDFPAQLINQITPEFWRQHTNDHKNRPEGKYNNLPVTVTARTKCLDHSMLYFSELSTDNLQKIIDYLPDSARTVSINRLAGIFLKHYIHNLCFLWVCGKRWIAASP